MIKLIVGFVIGVACGYFFKPQIDTLISKFTKKST